MTKTTYVGVWILAWLILLAAASLALSGCAQLLTRDAFDKGDARIEIFNLEADECESEAISYQRKFGYRNQYFLQCMTVKGYRVRN